MNNDVKKDLNDSILAFENLVLPIIESKNMINGNFISIEKITHSFEEDIATHFDKLSSIDLFRIKIDEGISGIASRVQFGKKAYNTFTIRKNRVSGALTELDKIIKNYHSGKYFYPHLYIHSYISNRENGEVLSFAIVETKTLIELYEKNIYNIKINRYDGNEFICFDWNDILKKGYKIKIYSI